MHTTLQLPWGEGQGKIKLAYIQNDSVGSGDHHADTRWKDMENQLDAENTTQSELEFDLMYRW